VPKHPQVIDIPLLAAERTTFANRFQEQEEVRFIEMAQGQQNALDAQSNLFNRWSYMFATRRDWTLV
jgi:hypothetical protein